MINSSSLKTNTNPYLSAFYNASAEKQGFYRFKEANPAIE
jgi:hypothetical protein